MSKALVLKFIGSSHRHCKRLKVNYTFLHALAFPNEQGFMQKLSTKPPNALYVEVVRVRHNLCHGNILEYVNTELGEEYAFFTPECCRELAFKLYEVSKGWAQNLGAFRRSLFNA